MPATTTTRPSRETGRPRVSAALLAALAGRLTGRDHELLELLLCHRVLTTPQISRSLFGTRQAAHRRLLTLHRHAAISRFRPWTGYGSAPWHWVLGPAGAHILATRRGTTVSELGWRHDHALAIAHTPSLGHLLGINDLGTRLLETARTSPTCQLVRWWDERACARYWGQHVRPDSYLRWAEDGNTADVFLEHDTGSEPLTRVTAKLGDYTALVNTSGIVTPVLFVLPSAAREAHLQAALQASHPGSPVPVATSTYHQIAEYGPAATSWQPATALGIPPESDGAGPGRPPRVSLLRLAALVHPPRGDGRPTAGPGAGSR